MVYLANKSLSSAFQTASRDIVIDFKYDLLIRLEKDRSSFIQPVFI